MTGPPRRDRMAFRARSATAEPFRARDCESGSNDKGHTERNAEPDQDRRIR